MDSLEHTISLRQCLPLLLFHLEGHTYSAMIVKDSMCLRRRPNVEVVPLSQEAVSSEGDFEVRVGRQIRVIAYRGDS